MNTGLLGESPVSAPPYSDLYVAVLSVLNCDAEGRYWAKLSGALGVRTRQH